MSGTVQHGLPSKTIYSSQPQIKHKETKSYDLHTEEHEAVTHYTLSHSRRKSKQRFIQSSLSVQGHRAKAIHNECCTVYTWNHGRLALLCHCHWHGMVDQMCRDMLCIKEEAYASRGLFLK